MGQRHVHRTLVAFRKVIEAVLFMKTVHILAFVAPKKK
jgi:hypothetical protein